MKRAVVKNEKDEQENLAKSLIHSSVHSLLLIFGKYFSWEPNYPAFDKSSQEKDANNDALNPIGP